MSAGSQDEGQAWSAAFVTASTDGMEAYDDALVGPVFSPWGGYLLDALTVTPGERLLDVATGPGTIARLASARLRQPVTCLRPTSVLPCSPLPRQKRLWRADLRSNTASALPRPRCSRGLVRRGLLPAWSPVLSRPPRCLSGDASGAPTRWQTRSGRMGQRRDAPSIRRPQGRHR